MQGDKNTKQRSELNVYASIKVLRTSNVSISTVMKRLLTGYVLWFNRRYGPDTAIYSRTATSLFYAKRMSIVLLGGERTGFSNDISFPFTRMGFSYGIIFEFNIYGLEINLLFFKIIGLVVVLKGKLLYESI